MSIDKKSMTLVGAALAAVFAILISFNLCACSSGADDGTSALFEVLDSAGYTGSEDAWVSGLGDEEQQAMVELAYETSVEDGYKGTQTEWLADKVRARLDSSGDVVVVLPDGGEFTISKEKVNAQASGDSEDAEPADGKSEGSTGEDVEAGEAADAGSAGEGEGLSAANVVGALLTVDSVQAAAGDDDVVVAVSIERNPGILGMTIAVSYDESALTLTSVENGAAFKDVLTLTHAKTFGSGTLFTWDGVELSAEDVQDGQILLLHFDVAKRTKAGTYPIVVTASGSAYDNNLEEVTLTAQNGSVVAG